MTSSSKLQEKMIELLSDEDKHSVQELKAYLSQNDITDYTEGQFAGSINTLLRNGTIQKLDRGVYAINKRSDNMKVCFVVSPIGEEGSEIRINADKLFKHIIKPVCEACNFNPIRVDQLNDSNSISQTIIEHLDSDDLVIADITGHNPNVFYEMGYRTKTKKPMIHLKRKDEKLPFDVNTIRTFDYDLTDLDSVEELKDRLQKTIESFVFSSDDEEIQLENSAENNSVAIMQVLYQILDTMGELKSDVKNFTTDTISTVVKSMQPSQPQLPPDTALQMQLMNGFLQNPEGFMKLIELSEKMNNKGKNNLK